MLKCAFVKNSNRYFLHMRNLVMATTTAVEMRKSPGLYESAELHLSLSSQQPSLSRQIPPEVHPLLKVPISGTSYF